MKRTRCLILEDSPVDAQYVVDMLEKRSGLSVEWQRVETEEEFKKAIEARKWDCILADWLVPGFGAQDAWRIYQEKKLDIPFIVVSGIVDEPELDPVLRDGAHGFVPKSRVSMLGALINRYLNKADLALGDMTRMLV